MTKLEREDKIARLDEIKLELDAVDSLPTRVRTSMMSSLLRERSSILQSLREDNGDD